MEKIVDLVRGSSPVSKLNQVERTRTVKALTLRIATITGWLMPEQEMYNILVDQFGKIICEQYASLNDQEIEYAFRQFGLTVKDWGKEMNLSMIHEVMAPFLALRSEVGRWEEQKQKEPPPPPPDRETYMNEWVEEERKKVDDGTSILALLPVDLYEWLVETGKIVMTDQEKKDIWNEAMNKRQAMIEPGSPAMSRFNRMKAAFEISQRYSEFDFEERAVIRGFSKKIALLNYLWNL